MALGLDAKDVWREQDGKAPGNGADATEGAPVPQIIVRAGERPRDTPAIAT